MKAQQIMDLLFDLGECGRLEKTCDTIKSGSPDAEVTKIAVSMFATPEVVRKAKETGAQLLVVHEPTYFNHWDEHSDEPFEVEKRRLIEEAGITIYRYHDYPHRAPKDMICEGEIKYMKLDGEVEYIGRFDKVRIRLNTPMTPRELAAHIEKNVGIRHIRIAGAADSPCTKITGMFGTPGGIEQELRSDDCEVVMTGVGSRRMGETGGADGTQKGSSSPRSSRLRARRNAPRRGHPEGKVAGNPDRIHRVGRGLHLHGLTKETLI